MRFRFKRLLSCALVMSMLSSSMIAYAGGGGTASGGNTGGTTSGSGSATSFTNYEFGVGYVTYLAQFGDFIVPTADDAGKRLEQTHFTRVYNEPALVSKIMSGQLFGRFDHINGGNKTAVMLLTADGVYRPYPTVYSWGAIPDAQNAGTVMAAMTDSDTSILKPTTVDNIPNGVVLADAFQRVCGDAGGKLTGLLNALTGAKGTIIETITRAAQGTTSSMSSGGASSGGSSEVNMDASVSAAQQAAVSLTIPEVIDAFNHYIDWWDSVYTSLGGNYGDGHDMAYVRSRFNDAKTAAAQLIEREGPIEETEILAKREFGDFAYVSQDEFIKYPCMGVNIICMRRCVGEPFTRAMTWTGALAGSKTAVAAGGNGQSYLRGWGLTGWPNGTNKGQTNMRAAGSVFINSFFYKNLEAGQPDISPVASVCDGNAGYVFFGFYGALASSVFLQVTITTTPDPDIPTPPPPVTADDVGTYYLMDYELNHVFDSMAEHYADNTVHDHARLNTGICTTDPNDYSDCGHGRNDYNTTEYSDIYYWEDDGEGKSVSMDNAGPIKLFLHNNASRGTIWWKRDEIRAGQVADSGSVGDYVIDYGFNLLRKHFDDAKAYSKIISQDVAKEYLENTLGMYEAIMVNNTVKKITPLRDSYAIIGETTGIKDELSWHAKYNRTGLTTKYYTQSASHSYSCGYHCRATCYYNTSHNGGAIQAFSVHGGNPSDYSVRLISIAHKYQTAPIPTGYAQPKDVSPFDYRPTTDGNGTDDDRQYRGSNTIDPGTEVTYVPEVPMIADEVPGPELEHRPKKVTTVGEEARKSKLILMTLYRMTGASNPVKGVVYSDTAVGGDAGLSSQTRSGGRLALTAGGDFTVKADTNMKVNLYGYALDLIEPGDTGYDTVTLGNDVKAGWGNSGSRTALMNKYQEWAAAMLNPKNYQADFEMTIGTKKYNSFSATVGSFSSKASQSTETGQYNIHVKHGKIQEDAGYNAFIAQLADDYGCSEGEAKTLFENSDMASAIIKAIEHDNSSLNKSKPAKYALGPGEIGTFNEPDLSSMLGNSSHWYDEEVRVFVLRRFMTPAATVNNIIAQDKMDIGNAMEVLGGDKMGHFKLNVWFRDSCYTRAVEEYIPRTGGDNKTTAIGAGDLIVAGVDVNGADFNITNATTATGKH